VFLLCFLFTFLSSIFSETGQQTKTSILGRRSLFWKELRPYFSEIRLGVLDGGTFFYIHNRQHDKSAALLWINTPQLDLLH